MALSEEKAESGAERETGEGGVAVRMDNAANRTATINTMIPVLYGMWQY
jgi:hypothetical protein